MAERKQEQDPKKEQRRRAKLEGSPGLDGNWGATETPVPRLLFNKVEVTEEQPASRSRAGSEQKAKTHAADEQELLAAPAGPWAGCGTWTWARPRIQGKSGKRRSRGAKHLYWSPKASGARRLTYPVEKMPRGQDGQRAGPNA